MEGRAAEKTPHVSSLLKWVRLALFTLEGQVSSLFFLASPQLRTFDIAECPQPLTLHDLSDGVLVAKILNQMCVPSISLLKQTIIELK